MTPIYQTSTYVQRSPGEHLGYEYARSQNPTREALEGCIASLEGAKHGIAFASGCAASATVMQTLSAGDRVLCSDDLYGGTYRLFSKVFARHGLSFQFIDMSDASNIDRETIGGAKIVWLETPSNPMLKVIDIEHAAGMCAKAGAKLVVDNTFHESDFSKTHRIGRDGRSTLHNEIRERTLRFHRRRRINIRQRTSRFAPLFAKFGGCSACT